MKKLIMAIILLSTIVIITACSIGDSKDEPKISLKFDVSNLTDNEFQYVGTKELENAIKEDFKNIEFTLDVKNSNEISNRKITVPDFKKIANSYDRNRYWFGNAYSQDNSSENFANYGYKFVFYSNELDEQTIKNIFNLAEAKVSWTKSDGTNEEKVFNLGDIIQFK